MLWALMFAYPNCPNFLLPQHMVKIFKKWLFCVTCFTEFSFENVFAFWHCSKNFLEVVLLKTHFVL